jgi:hypothetical protein
MMKTQLNLIGDSKTLDALARFLAALETMEPTSVTQPKAICGEDNVIYVEVGYRSEEDSFPVCDLAVSHFHSVQRRVHRVEALRFVLRIRQCSRRY